MNPKSIFGIDGFGMARPFAIMVSFIWYYHMLMLRLTGARVHLCANLYWTVDRQPTATETSDRLNFGKNFCERQERKKKIEPRKHKKSRTSSQTFPTTEQIDTEVQKTPIDFLHPLERGMIVRASLEHKLARSKNKKVSQYMKVGNIPEQMHEVNQPLHLGMQESNTL